MIPAFIFPNNKEGRYRLVNNNMLWYLASTRNKCAIRVYLYLYNGYLRKADTKEKFNFTNGSILQALGYEKTSRLASSAITNILEQFLKDGIIGYKNTYYISYDIAGQGTPVPCKVLLWVNSPSMGEEKISNLLNNNNLKFIKEKIFPNLGKFKFDFWVENKYIIEFDGMQHYQPVSIFGGEKTFKETQEHDKIKNQYCKDNNIPLIRIPYTQLSDMTIIDLLPEYSTFCVAD